MPSQQLEFFVIVRRMAIEAKREDLNVRLASLEARSHSTWRSYRRHWRRCGSRAYRGIVRCIDRLAELRTVRRYVRSDRGDCCVMSSGDLVTGTMYVLLSAIGMSSSFLLATRSQQSGSDTNRISAKQDVRWWRF